jgi:hypothetical protein
VPATLNVPAAQANSVAPLLRDDLPASVGSFSHWRLRWIACRLRNAPLAATA